MKLHKSLMIISVLMISALLSACSSGGGGDSSSGETGTVAMSLTDAMSNKFNAVYVTIDDVQVHLKGNGNGNNGWTSVSTPNLPKTFNLYELTNGVREEIGLADLEAGDYTQMRLIIGDEPDNGINLFSEAHPHANYVIDSDDSYQELKIPSGYQTGLKIVHGFTISANQTTELILDFHAEKSVIVAGNGENWHLKPTVKVGSTEEFSIISGRVTTQVTTIEDSELTGLEGAVVTAQQFDATAADEKDKVTIQASTVTDSDGYFSLFVSPDTYNIVVYADGMKPQHREIDDLFAAEKYTFDDDDIQLEVAKQIMKLTGGISIASNGTESDENGAQYASLSFRQEYDGQIIEITSADILNGQKYEINLPSETYTLVAWTADFKTQTTQIDENKTENGVVF